jgi:HK97 family phage prohead protease
MFLRELRNAQRLSMVRLEERLALSFAQGGVEMRAKPNGTAAGSNFEWRGYATVYDAPFQMWDRFDEPFMESVAQGACRRSLANPNLDVPFVFGHSEWGIPFANTKSGTMQLSEDSHGLLVQVPSMDGRREDVRALASAVERGDVSEMSLAFVCNRQEWDDAYEHRTVSEMDLHRGDVSAVIHGANPATAGAWMAPVEQLRFRRPAAIGGPHLLEARAAAMHNGHPRIDPDGDGDCDACPEGDTDHDYWTAGGKQIKPLPGEERAAGYPFELLAVSAAERDKAKKAGNSLPDGSYPINNVHQLHAAAVLAASHHGDWKAAQALIRRRAKELGVDVTTLPGFGEEKAAARPYELRASAAEDMDLATEPDYDAAAAHGEFTGTHAHPHSDYNGGQHGHEHTHNGDASHEPGDGHSHGTSANVAVDAETGIPGEEVQFSARRRLELMMAETELQELAPCR